jgi:hypothetical protein
MQSMMGVSVMMDRNLLSIHDGDIIPSGQGVVNEIDTGF